MPAFERVLRRFGAEGIYDVPISTSNLYCPNMDRVAEYSRPITDPRQSSQPGAVAAQLEERLAEYHSASHCVTFSSGFWALVVSQALVSLPGHDEVLIPSFTYRRLADAVHWAGKTPVFVDIEPDTLAMSVESTREQIGDRTGLLLAVHPIVNCCDADAFTDLSEDSGVPLVFDAVESMHETVGGRRVGSFDAPEVFSLHASKLVNGLEGGYVCTEDEGLAAELREVRAHGQVRGGTGPPGMNAVLADGHAAFTLASLDELDQNVEHNHRIYEAYRTGLTAVDGVRLLEFSADQQTSFKNIVVEVEPGYALTRDTLLEILNGERILARAHYDPPLHRKSYKFPTLGTGLSNSDQARGLYLNLPCGARVSTADVELVCELLDFLGNAPTRPTGVEAT
jgi:dTDP-4-amino-4,6-dideoxygalactose transaminase